MRLPKFRVQGKYKNIITVIVIISIAVLLFIYMNATKPKQLPIKAVKKAWMVETIKVNKQSLSPVYTLYGKVDTPKLVKVKSLISGQILQLAKAGEIVKKGQLMLALNKLDRQLPVDIASANLKKSQAQLNLQRLEGKSNKKRLYLEKKILQFKQSAFERVQKLMAKGLSSQVLLDQSQESLTRQEKEVLAINLLNAKQESKIQQMKAQVQTSLASLSKAKLDSKRSYIKASKTVRIAEVNVAEGEQVMPNTLIFSYYSSNDLEVKAQIPITLHTLVQQQFAKGSPVEAYTVKYKRSLVLDRLSSMSQTSGVNAFFKFKNNILPKNKHDNSKHIAIPNSIIIGKLITLDLKLEPQKQSFSVPYTALFGTDKIYVVKDGYLMLAKVKLLGDIIVEGKRWALLQGNDVPDKSAIMVTHLPNAINGLKVQRIR